MAGAKRAAALLAAAVAVIAAAGCGGGGGSKSSEATTAAGTTTAAAATTATASAPLTKAAYVTKMRAIGRSLSTSLNSLNGATTAAKAAVALTTVQKDLRSAAARINAISPPVAIKTQHGQLAKAVTDFANELSPIITKLKAGTLGALSSVPTLKGLREIQTASTAIANKGYKIGG
jgi:hypothetical protein